MRRLWQDIRTHPLAVLLFLALWVATWVVTVATWERDPAGYSVGMGSIAIPFHFVLPLVLGALIGVSRSGPPRTVSRTCGSAGLIFSVIHFAILWLVDVVWLPAIESGPAAWDLAAEALAFAIGYAAICIVLSVVGGRVAAAVAIRLGYGGGALDQGPTA